MTESSTKTLKEKLAAKALEEAAKNTDTAEKKYHMYYHAFPSCRMMTPGNQAEGLPARIITFIDHKHPTDQPDIIAYLDKEIALGNSYVKKSAELVSAAELNPENVLKQKYIDEFLANEKEVAEAVRLGKLNVSKYKPEDIKPASTAGIESLAAGSNS